MKVPSCLMKKPEAESLATLSISLRTLDILNCIYVPRLYRGILQVFDNLRYINPLDVGTYSNNCHTHNKLEQDQNLTSYNKNEKCLTNSESILVLKTRCKCFKIRWYLGIVPTEYRN